MNKQVLHSKSNECIVVMDCKDLLKQDLLTLMQQGIAKITDMQRSNNVSKHQNIFFQSETGTNQSLKCYFSESAAESIMASIFFCNSGLFAPTSLSICCPSLRKKKVGVALISHEVLNSCIIQPYRHALSPSINLDTSQQTHNFLF